MYYERGCLLKYGQNGGVEGDLRISGNLKISTIIFAYTREPGKGKKSQLSSIHIL
jgi:hypothetical protein